MIFYRNIYGNLHDKRELYGSSKLEQFSRQSSWKGMGTKMPQGKVQYFEVDLDGIMRSYELILQAKRGKDGGWHCGGLLWEMAEVQFQSPHKQDNSYYASGGTNFVGM